MARTSCGTGSLTGTLCKQMASTPGRNRIWIALSGLYLLLLVGVALFYLLDPELSAEDKLLTTVGVAAVPAVAFVAAAAPLLRKSRNRLALRGGAAFAWIAAFFQLMLTFGIALPLSLVLLGVAVGDLRRAPAEPDRANWHLI